MNMPRRNAGFFSSLIISAFFGSSGSLAGTLTVYAIPSPHGIDWTSPKSLTWSALGNQTSPQTHTIGHANIHLRCRIPDGDAREFEILTGMTSAENDPTNQWLKDDGYGLGILFATVPGRLETQAEVSRDLHHRFARGSVNFMQFNISATTCDRLAQYATEYQQRGYDQFYGLPNRPRHGEGAGCTAFAASFLDLAGLHTPHLKSRWSKSRLAPAHLTGGPLTGNFVPLSALLRPLRPSRWAAQDEPHFAINFFDPDALFQHIETSWHANKNPLVAGSSHDGAGVDVDHESVPAARISKIGRAKGFFFNANLIQTPDDPIWRQDAG